MALRKWFTCRSSQPWLGITLLLMAQGGVSGAYVDEVLSDNPAAYWRLGEADITQPMADSSGNNLHGEYLEEAAQPATGFEFGHPGAIAGDANTAVQFSVNVTGVGCNDCGHGRLDPNPRLDLGTLGNIQVTMEAWFRFQPSVNEALPGAQYARVFQYNNGEGGQYMFGFVSNNPAGFQHVRTPFAAVGTGVLGDPGDPESQGIAKSGPTDAVPPADEPEWHHYVATINNDVIRLYINGEDLGDLSDDEFNADPVFWQAQVGTVGGRLAADETQFLNPFPGLLDEVAIYPTILSLDRIRAHYNAGIRRLQCDLNGDGAADAADAAIMFGNWGRTGAGDCNGDNAVDAADAGVLFGEWTGDPSAGPGTAAAEYDVGTGEIKVAINDVVNWYIQSTTGGLTGTAVGDLPGPGLVTDNNSRVGETALGKFSYNANLGNVAAPGLPAGDLTIYWNANLGQPLQNAPVEYVPEPCGLLLAGFGISLAVCCRSSCRDPHGRRRCRCTHVESAATLSSKAA